MGTYRNVSNDSLHVQAATGAWALVAPGEEVTGSDATYWPCGVQGETAVWEPLDSAAKKAVKGYAQSEDERTDSLPVSTQEPEPTKAAIPAHSEGTN